MAKYSIGRFLYHKATNQIYKIVESNDNTITLIDKYNNITIVSKEEFNNNYTGKPTYNWI